MFLMSSLGYWIVLITYVTLLVMIFNNDKKKMIYVDSFIDDYFFNKLDWSVNFTYNNFKNTVYVFLFMISLVPVLNIFGTIYLAWVISKRV